MNSGPSSKPAANRSGKSADRVEVAWNVAGQLSAAHAAYVVATGANCTDPKTEALLIDPVAQINTRLVNESIDVAQFWRVYLAEIAAGQALDQACNVSLLTAGCSELQLDATAGAIAKRLAEAKSLFDRRYPKLIDQLELRGRPLRQRWETLGAGVLREVERLIWQNSPPDDWWPSRIQGYLVQPVRGGDGGWDGPGQRFWMEAMLTDADPVIPEVLRVGYLASSIAIENHSRSRSSESNLIHAWKLATVPIVLSAGTAVELVPDNPLPIARAMELWHVAPQSGAKLVSKWWDQWRSSPTALPVALRDLSGQLGK
jgi:hypothetical protein